ncbi:MAG: glycosyltransferase family 4 protein [Cyanobacteriota bacterium]|nr:glycosyltransferase family 4 protein [Cyanobacteriota bacterium]
MATIDTMIYLSPGNLPSQMAHTAQIAKMAQAFTQQVNRFELVTAGDWGSLGRRTDPALQEWYGLKHPLPLVRLPIHRRRPVVFPPNHHNGTYYRLASLYAYLRCPDLIYTRTTTQARYLAGLGVPFLWEWHEPPQPHHQDIVDSPSLLGLVTISPQLVEAYRAAGLDGDRILCWPSGADLEGFRPYQTQAQARQILNLPSHQRLILYSGHLQDYKGMPTVLAVAKQLPAYQFMLVGGWPADVERLRRQVQERGLTNVELVGHVKQSQLPTYLYAADVLLLPTSKTWELANTTSPLKLFDYMTVKRPVVASDLPTIALVLRDGHNGCLVEPDRPADFAQAITNLVNQPVWATALAEQAYRDVQAYSWDHRAREILTFAGARLAQHPQPSVPAIKRLVRCYRTLTTWYAG